MQDPTFTRCDETLQSGMYDLHTPWPRNTTHRRQCETCGKQLIQRTFDGNVVYVGKPGLILCGPITTETTTEAQLKPERLPHPSQTRHVHTSTSRRSPPGKDARQEARGIPNRCGTFAKRTSTAHASDWVAHQITMKTSRLTKKRPDQHDPANTLRPNI